MITSFHIIQLTAVILGAIAGYRLGHAIAGSPAAIAGMVAGLVLGWIIGRLPWLLVSNALVAILESRWKTHEKTYGKPFRPFR